MSNTFNNFLNFHPPTAYPNAHPFSACASAKLGLKFKCIGAGFEFQILFLGLVVLSLAINRNLSGPNQVIFWEGLGPNFIFA